MKAPKGSNEPLILVDETNRALGAAPKLAIHQRGLLHRAFSIFMVDDRGRILLQQRNPRKYHSGGLWANSCCGHPRPGERTVTAARRRLDEELGVRDPLRFGFFARYRAELDHGMQENEYVYVYFGRLKSQTRPDPDEVAGLEFLSLPELNRRIKRKPGDFTYWMKHYIRHHGREIARHIAAEAKGTGHVS
ncbi:MAG TPA: isopentenyl-diphosphate Delta-isomerase [Xanthobacteraceae bacterium]|jgi:isopentenyl-diphosphate delta-isomerase